MRRSWWMVSVLVVGWLNQAHAQDAKGCIDPAILPSRMPGYVISSCETTDFATQEFSVTDKDPIVVEGRKTTIIYSLGEGKKGASTTAVQRNYLNALIKIGGKSFSNDPVTVQLKKGGQETWVGVSGYVGEGTPDAMGQYNVVIIEKGSMEQVVTARDIMQDLRRDGRVALYVQFDTNQATIKSESAPLIKEMAKLLSDDPGLQVYVVGHTDTQGELQHNLKLSSDRAEAVVKALTQKHGVASKRCLAKGVGPLSPLASNDSEDGRKRNRRVELVKQ